MNRRNMIVRCLGAKNRWKGKKNRLRITRGAGDLVLAAPHSPWLMMVAMWLQSSVVTCPDIIRVASLLDMAMWSTGSYRSADGEEGRYCPISQWHMLRIWGAPFAHSCCLEPMHPLLTATQCPTLSAVVKLQCWKHWRRGLSVAIRRAGGGGCFSGSRKQSNCSSRRCTNNLQAAPWLKPTTTKLCILASKYASICHCRQRIWLSISNCSVFTFRCYCVRQQTSWVL